MRTSSRTWVESLHLTILSTAILMLTGIMSLRIVDGRPILNRALIAGNELTVSKAISTMRPTLDSIREKESVGSVGNSTPSKPECDASLWAKVYKPERLQIHNACVEVTGMIVDATHGKRSQGVRREADGDCHGWIRLDAGQDKYLNAGNMSDEEGNLVYEVVCLFPITQKDAVRACKGYKNKVKLAPVGSHVKMSGSWVQDDNHAKWFELHPVTSIEVIP